MDNGSTVNVMSLRMLRALGRGIGNQTKVFVLAFTREISKTLGILTIDINVDSKTSLSTIFVINFTGNYNPLFRKKKLDSCQLVCVVFPSPIFTILER